MGDSQLLFESHVGTLDWHESSFLCVLLGVGGPIDVEWRGGMAQADIILVPPSWQHLLRFHGHLMASIYYAPHQFSFAGLCSLGTPRFASWSEEWEAAYKCWYEAQEPTRLLALIEAHFGTDASSTTRGSLDARVGLILRGFWQGEGLEDSLQALAAGVGVSASRLAHLLKAQTGSSMRRLKRGYRFWHAARAMLSGPNFTEVAHVAGFSDGAHFSRSFRDTYGLAPSRLLLEATEWREVALLP